MLEQCKIGIFVMGGIAAYKVPELVRQLIKKGAQVRVAMTASAQEFVTPLTLQTLTKQSVLMDTFHEETPSEVQHIAMADWCDIAIVVPATANGIAKLAHGLADDVVTTTLLAVTAPKLVVPAMNVHMYENPATQRNLMQLKDDGMWVMEPEVGFLAEGYQGKGRLPELSRIVAMAENIVAMNRYEQVLVGKTVVITAGGTKERLDPVRYISNDSSGKMGYAMARAASQLGARVQLISTVPNLPVPEGVEVLYVSSALEMQEAVFQQLPQADYVVMAAAVSDYRVAQVSKQKLKKQVDKPGLTLELVENPDILATLVQKRTTQTIIGFAAETENVLAYAQAKLMRKGCDWLCANDVSQEGLGFNSEHNQITLLAKDGRQIPLEVASKEVLARQIWQVIQKG